MKYTRLFSLLIAITFVIVQLSACSILDKDAVVDTQYEYPKAEVVFEVNVPEPLPEGTKMVLEILDDVTGLYFNSSRFEMAAKDDFTYFIRIPLTISSEVKYRYIKAGTSSEYEYNAENQQVRFRILRVDGPQIVQDIISTWIGKPYTGEQGRIRGQVIDRANNAPIPNLLVCAGGLQTVTSSDGTFLLDGLRPGVHNLVIYSMDGAYETFQQGALIADGGVTPVLVYIEKRDTTEVTFTATLPKNIDPSLPVRFVSNLLNLGNSYADLSAGSAGSAENYPVMNKIAGNTYAIKLTLPVGAFIRYKYSLGDGFWNAELNNDGKFVVRDLIIEKNNHNENDKVTTFTAAGFAPVSFSVQVPASTPSSEQVSLQLNPFSWMEPIPMVPAGGQEWKFTLYNPTHLLGSISYRFCRNTTCEIATGKISQNSTFQGTAEPQTFATVVTEWGNLDSQPEQAALVTEGGPSQPRPDFMAGIELTSSYLPSWEASIDQGLEIAYSMGGDWVIFTPTWSVTADPLPRIEAVPGADFLWNELQDMHNHILMNKQATILFPTLNYTQSYEKFWDSTTRSSAWWNKWYENYSRFILSNADLASILGIRSLMIGDPSVIPSMNGGILPNGELSDAPSDADVRWRQLVSDLRSRYKGSLIGVAVIDSDREFVPEWLESVDAIYVIFSPALSNLETSNVTQLRSQFDALLTEKVKPIADQYGKPILLGISYPSNMLASDGYTLSSQNRITLPTDVSGVDKNLQVQSRIYNAAILSASSVDWIKGFFSRGYYPYVTLQDASSSIYKKPASDILWFWYHFLLNKSS